MDKLQSNHIKVSKIIGYWKEQWDFVLERFLKLIGAKMKAVPSTKYAQPTMLGIKLNKKSTDIVNNFLKKNE